MSRPISEIEAELKAAKKLARCPRKPGDGLGGMIQQLRHDKGMSLRELAKKSNVALGTLSKIERQSRPNTALRVLDRIAYGLGKSLLLGFKDIDAKTGYEVEPVAKKAKTK